MLSVWASITWRHGAVQASLLVADAPWGMRPQYKILLRMFWRSELFTLLLTMYCENITFLYDIIHWFVFVTTY